MNIADQASRHTWGNPRPRWESCQRHAAQQLGPFYATDRGAWEHAGSGCGSDQGTGPESQLCRPGGHDMRREPVVSTKAARAYGVQGMHQLAAGRSRN
jgi:hypothetical protein